MLCIKQGGHAIKLFKPIVKEYRDAQNGMTNGITMYERKSKLMQIHRIWIFKWSCMNIISGLLAIPFAISMLGDCIDQVVPIFYEEFGIP